MSVHIVAYFAYIKCWLYGRKRRSLGVMMQGAISLLKSTGGITLKSLKTKRGCTRPAQSVEYASLGLRVVSSSHA